MEAFDYLMLGAGIRIALGPFKFLYRDPKWRESCRSVHQAVERYAIRAIESRQEGKISSVTSTSESQSNRRQHVLLYALAQQTDDKTQLRNEIIQALMAAQETTASLISNVFFFIVPP